MPEIERSEAEWRETLSPAQYEVLRQAGTERAWTGKYVDEHADGTYRCAACGAELFDSAAKFESGSGWPSFYQTKAADVVDLISDHTHDALFTVTHLRCVKLSSIPSSEYSRPIPLCLKPP